MDLTIQEKRTKAIAISLASILFLSVFVQMNPLRLADAVLIFAEDVQTGSAEAGGTTSVSTSSVVTAVDNQLYVASVSTKPLSTITSVTGLGLAWTLIRDQCSGRSQTGTSVWYAVGTTTGDSVVTANISPGVDGAVIAVVRYSGTNTSEPIGNNVGKNSVGVNDTTCTGGTDAASYTVNLTVANAEALAFGAVAIRQRSHTPGAGYTERFEINSGGSGSSAGVAGEDKTVSSIGIVVVDGTTSSTVDYAVVAVEIKPGVAASVANVKTGTCAIAALASSVSCTISPALTDTTKTFMVFQATSSDNTPNSSNVRCYVAGTSTITCERNGTTGTVNIRWHAAEFSQGVTVEHLQPACVGGTTNVSITRVDSMSKTFLLFSSERDGFGQGNDDFRLVRLTSPTNVEIVFSDIDCDFTEYALQVVQFNGASVTRGLTGAMTGASQPVSGLSAVDTTKTMLIYSYRSASGGADICERMVRGEITSATSLSFSRSDGAAGCITEAIDDIAWERVEFTEGTTVEEVLVTMAAGVGTANVGISSVDTSRTIPFGGGQWASGQATGEGSYQADDIVGTMLGRNTLTSPTNLQVVRDNTGGTARWTSYVVQFASNPPTTEDNDVQNPNAWLFMIAPLFIPQHNKQGLSCESLIHHIALFD